MFSSHCLAYYKFSLPWQQALNRGWSETNFTYTVKFADPENPLIGAIIGCVSSIQAEL